MSGNRMKLFWAAAAVLSAAPAFGQAWKDDIGHTQLKNELGTALPTGTGVPVSFVESYFPDPEGFVGDNITYYDGSTVRTTLPANDPLRSSLAPSTSKNHAN